MKTEIIAMIKEGYEGWFIKNFWDVGFTIRIGRKNVLVKLQMDESRGLTEVYLVPVSLINYVDLRLNTYEYGCDGKVTMISNLNGNKMRPLNLSKKGMAMFSVMKDFKFISVIIEDKFMEIVENQISEEKFGSGVILYQRKVILKGKYNDPLPKNCLKYSRVVEAAIKRSSLKGNPEYPLYVDLGDCFN